MKYTLNNKPVEYSVVGEKYPEEDTILLHKAVDLTKGQKWSDQGFTIEKLFEESLFQEFKNKTNQLLGNLWRKAGLDLPPHFKIENYHSFASDQASHLSSIEKTKLLSVDDFPVPIRYVEERISEICNTKLNAKNPFDGQRVFHFRVIRPRSGDNNPLHRDVWLEDYSNCINLYIPVAGSNENSSLAIIPGSHQWPENKIERTDGGAVINQVKYNVPAVISIRGAYEIVRPDPKENEVLIFSPYLIHGGSANLNQNQTRVSIELRLWKSN